jgi:hypothetical protein
MSILLGAYALANDFGGVDQIPEDSIMDSGKGSAARTLLLNTRAASRKREDTSLSNEDNMTIREFLLQFTGKPSCTKTRQIRNIVVSEKLGYLCCTLWKPANNGTGTKITIAFLP